jgi:hypothetical protein
LLVRISLGPCHSSAGWPASFADFTATYTGWNMPVPWRTDTIPVYLNLGKVPVPSAHETPVRSAHETFKYTRSRLQVIEFGLAKLNAPQSYAGFVQEDSYQTIGIGVGQRTQQHGIHDAENGRVGSHAQSHPGQPRS